MMESQSVQGKTEEPASLSQSDTSSQETVIEPFNISRLVKRVQDWILEATVLISSLQDISPSYQTEIRLSIEKWIREQQDTRLIALSTRSLQLLQSILSPAEIKTGRNFCLEKKTQHSKQSNKQISKAPETRNSSGRKAVKAYVVKPVDKPLDENALTAASGKMPEVRLVIKSPYIRSVDFKNLGGSIRYPSQELTFKHMFGVVQDTVDFTVKSNLRFDTHMEEPFEFWCDIIYDPASNDCHLYNRSGLSIYLISSNESQTKQKIDSGGLKPLCSGAWRISTKPDKTPTCLYPIFDILVRDKGFSISADNDNKVPTVLGTNLFPKDPREVQYTTMSLSRTRTSILDLADGERVRIKDLHDDKRTYELHQIEKIAGSTKTTVFSCRHSGLPKVNLVAKVFRFDDPRLVPQQMKREMELLKQLSHENIVSLEEADPRVFALYLEYLPPSLDKNCELKSSWADAKIILFDIASALAYLSERKIIHYDVKPANIAFSRERGAILFDFDLGGYLEPKYGKPGGTMGYLPPETIQPRKTRGLPGDVWALGVTILYIMEWYEPIYLWVWNVNDFHRPGSPTYKAIEEQVRSIDLKRGLLNLEDKVQTLVYRMLEPKSESRVTAADIHREDDRKPQGCRSAKKRKHSDS